MNKKKTHKNLFRQYLKRHIILAVAIVLLIAYYALRNVRSVADFVTININQPWYSLSGRAFSVLPFSVAEWLCALAVIGILAYLAFTVYMLVRKPKKLRRAYATLSTFLALTLTFYACLCWSWGIGFYSYSLTELSGIEAEAVSLEELKETTIYFAEAANAAGAAVNRDEQGLFVYDKQRILGEAPKLFANLPEEFDFLIGPEIRPKPLVFSYVMSQMNFTGGFFPFTGEANINVHSPDCFIPSTVAHELTHQRGVVREQDANLIAILVCMESGDADFVYSGALLAYIHLAHALKQASYEDWVEVSSLLDEKVIRDLEANNEYWAQFNTQTARISEAAYEGFLQNQGQELGMRSYGACVDMLVAYYRDK